MRIFVRPEDVGKLATEVPDMIAVALVTCFGWNAASFTFDPFTSAIVAAHRRLQPHRGPLPCHSADSGTSGAASTTDAVFDGTGAVGGSTVPGVHGRAAGGSDAGTDSAVAGAADTATGVAAHTGDRAHLPSSVRFVSHKFVDDTWVMDTILGERLQQSASMLLYLMRQVQGFDAVSLKKARVEGFMAFRQMLIGKVCDIKHQVFTTPMNKVVDCLKLLESDHFSSSRDYFELQPVQQAHGKLRDITMTQPVLRGFLGAVYSHDEGSHLRCRASRQVPARPTRRRSCSCDDEGTKGHCGRGTVPSRHAATPGTHHGSFCPGSVT